MGVRYLAAATVYAYTAIWQSDFRLAADHTILTFNTTLRGLHWQRVSLNHNPQHMLAWHRQWQPCYAAPAYFEQGRCACATQQASGFSISTPIIISTQ
jgi:hypothetical protein